MDQGRKVLFLYGLIKIGTKTEQIVYKIKT